MESSTPARARAVVGGILRTLGAVVLLLALPGLLQAGLLSGGEDIENPRNKRIEGSYQYIRAHLQAPHDGYSDLPGVSVSGWKIAALSHMATGLMSMALDARESGDKERLAEVTALLEEVARERSDQPQPWAASNASPGQEFHAGAIL